MTIKEKRARTVRRYWLKHRAMEILEMPLCWLAKGFMCIYKVFKALSVKREKKVFTPISLDPSKANKYLTKLIECRLKTPGSWGVMFSENWYGTRCDYSYETSRNMRKAIAKWWKMVDKKQLVDYIQNQYDHPECEKFTVFCFSDLLRRYTTKLEWDFNNIPVASPEYAPMIKATADWDLQTELYQSKIPYDYPSRYEVKDALTVFIYKENE